MIRRWRRIGSALLLAATLPSMSGCGWRGLNSLQMPGTQGGGRGAFVVQAQMPEVGNLAPNTAVQVNDVTVGNVAKIERQGWHALVTMRLNGDVNLPSNSTVTLAQTSLLATLHLELAPPVGIPAQGRLANNSLIPLSAAGSYPTNEQTLAMLSMLLSGGGLGQLQDITKAFGTAFGGGHGQDLRKLLQQLNKFVGYLNSQKDDIIDATDSLNQLVSKFAAQKPVVDKALSTVPQALSVLADERENLTDAIDQFGKLSALTADSVNKTKASLVAELKDVGPVLESLANAGPDMTRALDFLSTFPWIKSTVGNFQRGDYANLTAVFDLTLSRLDNFFTGTRWEGNLTELEMYWGRTVGQTPSPVTARNPLVVPYRLDQGP